MRIEGLKNVLFPLVDENRAAWRKPLGDDRCYTKPAPLFLPKGHQIGGEKMWDLEMDDLQIINWDVLGGLSKI